jgi:peptidase MA superfamily protein
VGLAVIERRIGRVALALVVVVLTSLTTAPIALAAAPVFGKPTVEGSFDKDLVAGQPVTFDAAPDRVEVLVTTADSPAPLVSEVRAPSRTGFQRLEYTVAAADGPFLPNTPVRVRWRITTDGVATLGPEIRTIVADERFDWQTVSGDVVRVHWYEGDRAFAEHALRIGERTVKETADLLGVTEDQPVDFFIYADQVAFYEALGPGTRENVGGQANADIRTLFAHIPPSSIDDPWVENVVPHELVHLVFDTAVKNPYHFPPRWLNEGLAVYLSVGYDAGDRSSVERAARDGELIPLDGLGGQFPTSADRFGLAYSESASAVDFFVRTHGRDALVQLIRSYADGRTDDEAFSDAIGMGVGAFNDAWLADLNAVAPERYGPQPAPAGPLPREWGGTGASEGPTPTDPTLLSGTRTLSLVAILGVIVIVAGILVLRERRRRASRRTVAPGS